MNSLWKVLALMLVLSLWIGAAGCSTPDPDDMQQLESGIEQIPPMYRDVLIHEALRARALRIIDEKLFGKDELVLMTCKDPAGKLPSNSVSMTVQLWRIMVRDGTESGRTPLEHIDHWISTEKELQESNGRKCQVFDLRNNIIGKWKNYLGGGGMSAREIAEELIRMPVPPSGLPWGGALAPLLPILCTLAVPWGCPDGPGYPGPTVPGNAPPPNGDAP